MRHLALAHAHRVDRKYASSDLLAFVLTETGGAHPYCKFITREKKEFTRKQRKEGKKKGEKQKRT